MLERLLILVLLASGMCSAIMYSSITPVLPGLAAFFGGGEQGSFLAQSVMTMPGLGMMVGGPLSGLLIERLGERRVIIGSLVLFSLAGAAGLVLNNAAGLLGSRFLVGVAASSFTTASLTLMSWRFPLELRTRLIGYQSALGGGMGLLALLAAGVSADLGSWRTPFSFHLLALGFLFLAILVVPGPRPGTTSAPRSTGSLKPLLPIYLCCVPLFITVFTTSVQAPFLLESVGVDSAGLQSRVLALGVLAHAIGAWSFGTVMTRLGRRGSLALALGLMSLGHLLLGLADSAVVVAAGCVTTSLGSGMLVPYLTHTLVERTQPALRGRALGLFPVFTFLGSLCNPLAYTPLTAWLGIQGALTLVAVALGVGAVAGCMVMARSGTAPSF